MNLSIEGVLRKVLIGVTEDDLSANSHIDVEGGLRKKYILYFLRLDTLT